MKDLLQTEVAIIPAAAQEFQMTTPFIPGGKLDLTRMLNSGMELDCIVIKGHHFSPTGTAMLKKMRLALRQAIQRYKVRRRRE